MLSDLGSSTSKVQNVPLNGGFWRRAVAYLFDLLFLELLFGVFLFLGATAVDLAEASDFQPLFFSESLASMTLSLVLLWVSLFLLYFTFFTHRGGQTPGKMLVRVRVVTRQNDEVTLLRALGRSAGYFLSSAFFGIGFMLAAFHPEKRALHDLLAGTRVIRT
jgi:uncharacterized RDD family membrane protein YckC